MKIKRRKSLKALIRSGPSEERRVVQIYMNRTGLRDVDAHVIGPLAVHRENDVPELINTGSTYWNVTHIRTGCAVIGQPARATFKQAMQIAKECARKPVWDFGEFGKVPAKDTLREVRALVKAAGIRAGLKLRKPRTVKRIRKRTVKRVKRKVVL